MDRILFVDDEVNILQGLKRMLRPMREKWEMSFAVGGKEAMEYISQQPFEIIVTDMRMPEIDGMEVLKFVKEYDSSISRIVLSGQTDKERFLTCSGMAHQLISKPCDAEKLLEAITHCLNLRNELDDKGLAKLVGTVDSLPSLPQIYQELSQAMNDDSDNFSLDNIAKIISKDISMSAKILHIVNSAYFGLAAKIDTAHLATVYLGSEMIRNLALTESVFRQFSSDKTLFSIEALWQHSISVGILAGLFAKEEKAEESVVGQVQQAGSLHDVGKLVLSTTIPEKYSQLLAQAKENDTLLHQVEEQTIGKDHGKVGAYLLGLWGLPDQLVNAVAFHHCPDQSNQNPLDGFTPLIAVHVANAFIHSFNEDDIVFDHYLNSEWLDYIGFGNKINRWAEIAHSTLTKEKNR